MVPDILTGFTKFDFSTKGAQSQLLSPGNTTFTSETVIVTIAVLLSPLASSILYSNESSPEKSVLGVYKIVSSVGSFGVPFSLTTALPFLGLVIRVIGLLDLPSIPKSSLLTTSIFRDVFSKSCAKSF